MQKVKTTEIYINASTNNLSKTGIGKSIQDNELDSLSEA